MISYNASSPAEAAENGRLLLNDVKPGWHHDVSRERLDLLNYERCVLGQVYGNYKDAVLELSGHESETPEGIGWAQAHGFLGPVDPDEMDDFEDFLWARMGWAELGGAWLQLLKIL